jgi:hypothetical protein
MKVSIFLDQCLPAMSENFGDESFAAAISKRKNPLRTLAYFSERPVVNPMIFG